MKNNVAFVTGASRGMGEAVALDLARQGYDLFLIARSQQTLQAVALACEQHHVKAIAFNGDVSDAAFAQAAVTECIKQFGQVHVAFINQGISTRGYFPELEDWEQVMQVNLIASMRFTQLLLPFLIDNDGQQRALIFTGSVSSRLPSKFGAAYVASKHGLIGFAHCIYEEVREQGVKVSTICPGFVDTTIVSHREGLDTQRMIQTSDIVDTMNYILQSASTVCPVEITLRPQRTPCVAS